MRRAEVSVALPPKSDSAKGEANAPTSEPRHQSGGVRALAASVCGAVRSRQKPPVFEQAGGVLTSPSACGASSPAALTCSHLDGRARGEVLRAAKILGATLRRSISPHPRQPLGALSPQSCATLAWGSRRDRESPALPASLERHREPDRSFEKRDQRQSFEKERDWVDAW